MKHILIVVVTAVLFGCKDNVEEKQPTSLTANAIVNKAIEASGGNKLKNAIIQFQFRGRNFKANRSEGKFELSRNFIDKDGDTIVDILNNSGFERAINGNIETLDEVMKNRYAASVNSVHYFSVLPYGLNDQAVQKTLLGEEAIKGKIYYKVKVTFSEENGGEDFEDIFLYWFDKQNFKLYYLAYSYNEDNDKGLRFREAYNARNINGIQFVDYNNYKPKSRSDDLMDLGKQFENNQLELLSKIELETIKVDLINP